MKQTNDQLLEKYEVEIAELVIEFMKLNPDPNKVEPISMVYYIQEKLNIKFSLDKESIQILLSKIVAVAIKFNHRHINNSSFEYREEAIRLKEELGDDFIKEIFNKFIQPIISENEFPKPSDISSLTILISSYIFNKTNKHNSFEVVDYLIKNILLDYLNSNNTIIHNSLKNTIIIEYIKELRDNMDDMRDVSSFIESIDNPLLISDTLHHEVEIIDNLSASILNDLINLSNDSDLNEAYAAINPAIIYGSSRLEVLEEVLHLYKIVKSSTDSDRLEIYLKNKFKKYYYDYLVKLKIILGEVIDIMGEDN